MCFDKGNAGLIISNMCFNKRNVSSWNKMVSTFKIVRLWKALVFCFKEKTLSIQSGGGLEEPLISAIIGNYY